MRVAAIKIKWTNGPVCFKPPGQVTQSTERAANAADGNPFLLLDEDSELNSVHLVDSLV